MKNISFDSGMPIVEGTWYNPKTGDSFTARDTFFEDNNLIVMTTDGRRMNYNSLQNYVKSDKPIKIDRVTPQQKQTMPVEPATFEDNILDDDLKAIYGVSPISNYETTAPAAETTQKQETAPAKILPFDQITLHIIETAIGECELPKFKVSVDWKEMPKDEILMLVKMMKITPEQIAAYVINKIDLSEAQAVASNSVSSLIDGCFVTEAKAAANVQQSKPAAKAPAKPVKKAPAKPAKKAAAKPAKKK